MTIVGSTKQGADPVPSRPPSAPRPGSVVVIDGERVLPVLEDLESTEAALRRAGSVAGWTCAELTDAEGERVLVNPWRVTHVRTWESYRRRHPNA